MKLSLLCVVAGLLSFFRTCNAQEYTVGAMSGNGFSIRIEGRITIADSLITFDIDGKQEIKKVLNRTGYNVYITDGTATDRLTITPMSGKMKGVAYNHTIVYDADKRFSSAQVIYYCKKED